MVDAALGTTVTVDAILDGLTEITIPPGTQPGSVTTLRGHGMPQLRSGVRGNLHAHIEVVVPAKLDHKDTELLRELKTNRSRDVAEVGRPTPAPSHQRRPVQPAARDVLRPLSASVSDALFYVDALPEVGGLAVVDGDEGFHAATVRRLRVGKRSCSATAPANSPTVRSPRPAKRELTAARADPPDRRPRRSPRSPSCRPSPSPSAPNWRSNWPPRPAPTRSSPGRPRAAWPAGTAPKADKGLRRWRAVARSAARQSRRAFIPGVDGVITTRRARSTG